MIGKLHLGAGSGAGLKGRGHLNERDRMAGSFFCGAQALLRSIELPVGGSSACTDFAATPECARGVSGQMTGHLGEVVMAGAAEAHRPGKCGGCGLGQVAQKAQACLFGGVLVVKRLNGVAASVDLRTQLRGSVAERIGTIAAVHLDVQQDQIPPMGRDPNRGRIHRCGQVADHYGPQPGLHAHRAAALHARAVLEDGHGPDRRVEASALRHPALLSACVRFHRAEPVPASIRPSLPIQLMIRDRALRAPAGTAVRPAADTRKAPGHRLLCRLRFPDLSIGVSHGHC